VVADTVEEGLVLFAVERTPSQLLEVTHQLAVRPKERRMV
jgi:hypothetical protein